MRLEKIKTTMVYLDNQSVTIIGDRIKKGLRGREQKVHINHFELKMSVTQSNKVLWG